MSMMKIEVVPDPSVSAGGHAIIRLKGVALLPPGATFRIDPIDDVLAEDDGWPLGDMRPLETRQTPEGLELRIGPDVVDAPLLEPGLPVTISVPEAHLSAEIVWPSLPASSGPATAAVVMTPSQMVAEIAAAERAKTEARLAAEQAAREAREARERDEAEIIARRDAAVAAAIAAAVAAASSVAPTYSTDQRAAAGPDDSPGSGTQVTSTKTADATTMAGDSKSAGDGDAEFGVVDGTVANTDTMSAELAEPAVAKRGAAAVTRGALDDLLLSDTIIPAPDRKSPLVSNDGAVLGPSLAQIKPFEPRVAEAGKPMLEATRQLDALLAKDAAQSADSLPNGYHNPNPFEPLATLAAGHLSPQRAGSSAKDVLSKLNIPQPPNAAERDSSLPAIVVRQQNSDANVPRVTALSPVATGPATPKATSSVKSSRMVAFLAGAMTAVAGALVVVGGGFFKPTTGNFATVAPPPAEKIGIADVFTAGPQSPRGEPAANVDLSTALKMADYNLHGVERPADRVEAEFWLKKALSLTASHAQLRWALTQLGTMSAQPVSGPPDYDKARMLWEIAAFNGDAIAMCFLGTLAENGLGSKVDRGKALEYYKRAKEIGGCPTSDEAISRLSR
jgi:hypothetical protein